MPIPGPPLVTRKVSDLLARTRRLLAGPTRPALALLGSGLSSTGDDTTTVTIQAGGSRIAEGDYLSIGLETVYVLAVQASDTVTVLRAQEGTSKQTASVGDRIRINDPFSDAAIFDTINDELLALPAEGLYQVKALSFTYDTSIIGYDLADDMLDSQLLDARWSYMWNDWPTLDGYSVTTDMDTADFPSGRALLINHGCLRGGATVRVSYRSAFDPFETVDDDVTAWSGLPDTAHDLLWLGAAIRLMAGQPIARADYAWQGQPRRAAEATTSDVLNAAGALRALRAQRIADEVVRLHAANPTRAIRRSL